MLHTEVLYDLNDVSIIPADVSKIRHRTECKLDYIPIFTAPMNSVVNEQNYHIFEKAGITPIIPRTVKLEKRFELAEQGIWIAVGLDEFETYFINSTTLYKMTDHLNILIDIANGHIKILEDYIKKSKQLAIENLCSITLMCGNVANPETYDSLAAAGCDFCRIGIGGGGLCITSSNTGIHMPMASLIDRCRNYKVLNRRETKIVADGGISSYSRAIKALALGADYVMMGSALCQCFESASDFVSVITTDRDLIDGFDLNYYNQNKFTDLFTEDEKKQFIGKYLPKKVIYGMSTKKAQMKIAVASGKICKLKTSEGIEKQIEVKYTLAQYLENFLDYLRSAMSYTNSTSLEQFHYCSLYILSESARNAINK